MNVRIATAAGEIFLFFTRKETLGAEEFTALLEPVEESLYNFILRSLNFSEDAEDVYQDAVLRALKYLKSYNPQRSFKTWIFSIAANEMRCYFNKSNKNRNVTDVLEEESVPDNTDTEEAGRLRAIYDVARKLKPKHREVFFLFYQDGFSINEINEITGLKSGNIKFILNKARETVKSNLGVNHDQ